MGRAKQTASQKNEAEIQWLKGALDKVGAIIEAYGLGYAPIFERLEAELAAREHRSPSARARELIRQSALK